MKRFVTNGNSFRSSSHYMVIKADNSLWGWGDNSKGQLGNGTTENQTEPVKVKGIENVIAVYIYYKLTMAITADGTLYAWGDNSEGLLGDGTTENRLEPVKIMENVVAVSLDSCVMAITNKGVLYAWGSNRFGLLCDEKIEYSYTPIKIMENVAMVLKENNYAMAIKTDGNLWAWGSKTSLGDDKSSAKVYDFIPSIASINEYIQTFVQTRGFVTQKYQNIYDITERLFYAEAISKELGETEEFQKINNLIL